MFNTPKIAPEEHSRVEHSYNNVVVRTDHAHLQSNLGTLVKAPKFKEFIDNMKEIGHFSAVTFNVTDIDLFGSSVGFYKGKLEAYNTKTGKAVQSNICNNRGGCTSCLFIVTCVIDGEKRKMIPVVVQDRLPSGGECEEIVAGMKDNETGRLKTGKLASEVTEELPICDITEDDPELIYLGEIFPSPGWSDECIELWAKELEITEKKYNFLREGTFGEGDHEVIKVKFYEYNEEFKEDVVPRLNDAKLLSALYKYESYLEIKERKKKGETIALTALVSAIIIVIAMFALVLLYLYVAKLYLIAVLGDAL
jgi:hypothetical protein